MPLLPRKGLLAIVAVVDVALHSGERPVSARKLAARHNLPARHLEPVLQALVHEGIFNGVRGPRGGYELARERKRISVAIRLLESTRMTMSEVAASVGFAEESTLVRQMRRWTQLTPRQVRARVMDGTSPDRATLTA